MAKDDAEAAEIGRLQEERRRREQGFARFGEASGDYDTFLYGDDQVKRKQPRVVEEVDEESPKTKRRALPTYTAPVRLFEEDVPVAAAGEQEGEPQQLDRTNSTHRPVADREDEYRKQWRKRQLSPPAVDPFRGRGRGGGRTYRDTMREHSLQHEERELLHELALRNADAASSARETQQQQAAEARTGQVWSVAVVKGGVTVETTSPITAGTELRFGRDEGSDVVLAHPSCSGRHAKIRASADGSGLAVVDLKSTNGTFIGGQRLNPGQYRDLHDGDIITFASSTRQYVVVHR